jgi:AcrR family transcriptional regulator
MNIKKYIETMLMQLLRAKSIDKIKVSEIIAEVGTCKGTFYKYYIDKYELLLSCFQKHIYSDILAKTTTWEEFVSCCLAAFAKDPDMVLNAFRSEDINSIKHFHKNLVKTYLENDLRRADDKIGEIVELALSVYASNCTDIMLEWLEGGMKESKERVMTHMCGVMPRAIDIGTFDLIAAK